MPPAIMVQRFCIIVAVILSSQQQVIFIPPLHFSIVILQRGTIIHCGAAGIVPVPLIAPKPMVPIPIPGMPMPARSIIMVLIIAFSPHMVTRRLESTPSAVQIDLIISRHEKDASKK